MIRRADELLKLSFSLAYKRICNSPMKVQHKRCSTFGFMWQFELNMTSVESLGEMINDMEQLFEFQVFSSVNGNCIFQPNYSLKCKRNFAMEPEHG